MPDPDPGTVAPVVTPMPAASAVTPPVAPPTKVVTTDDLPAEALSKRIEQAQGVARTKLLEELGVTDTEEAKSAIAAAKAAKEAAKTTEQKLAEQNVRLSSQEQGLAAAVDAFSRGITEAQKAAVDKIAKSADGSIDKAAWLRAYDALAPTWATGPAAAATTEAPAAAPAAPPATTSPPAAAPSPAGSISPPDIKATYETLKQRNPVVAAAFAEKNSKALFG